MKAEDRPLFYALLAVAAALILTALSGSPECAPVQVANPAQGAQNEQNGVGYAIRAIVLLQGPRCGLGYFIIRHKDVIDGLSTLAIALFTIVLATSTYRLWNSTKGLHEETALLVKLAKKQADVLPILERAYLAVDANGIEGIFNEKPIASIEVFNAGHVPARGIRWTIATAIDEDRMRQSFPPDDEKIIPSTNILAPGAKMRRFLDHTVTEPERALLYNGKYAWYVWGKIYYFDGFSTKERWIRFCHRYEPDCRKRDDLIPTLHGVRARQHQYGNSTDEDETTDPKL